jgi:hypothetical protein
MQMMMRKLALAATLCVVGSGYAQTTTQGAITGTVFDATNAAIPGATILIHNDATNAEITLTSNSSGFFTAPQIAPGTYTVTIKAPGFSEQRQSKVVVEVNLATEVSPHLTTGETSTVVDVTAEAPVLNFESAEFGGHLTNIEIESIPVNNRRWSSLALLTPGVVNDANGFGLLSFRAISPLLNNVEIDGADDNQAFFSEERGRTRAGYSTSQVAVREFQVNTGVYSAEFGRAVGGVVNSVTKSGGNQLHGELYFYNRNSSRSAIQPLATTTAFNAASNAFVTSPIKPKDNRNQYGFGIGGPIIKDKLFFFYAFDVYARNFPGTAKPNSPSFFLTPNVGAPANGGTCNVTTGAVTTPAGGTAASATDSAACLLAARLNYATPGSATYATAATSYTGQLQALAGDLGSVPRFGNQEINTPKLDFQISPKEHLSLLYHRLRWDSPGGVQTQGTNNYAIDTFGTDFVKLDYGVGILESQISSRLTNELRYQYGRELNDEGRQTPSAYTNANLTGTNGVPPEVQLYTTTGFYLGTPYYSFRTAYPDERKWQIGDTASFLIGKNTIKFGEDFVHNNDLVNNLYEGNGYYNYSVSGPGNYFADLLTKKGTCSATGTGTGPYPCYGSFAQGFGNPILEVRTQDYGAFIQDDFKASPRLTLNLGVRFDRELLPAPDAPNPAATVTLSNPSGHNNFAPRIGFAWDPYGTGKTAVHGGFGMYYGRIFNSLLLNTFENSAGPLGQLAYSFTPSTVGAPLLPNVASTTPPAGAIGPSIEFLDSHLHNPYSEQFDLAVQQELGLSTVLSVSYVGALSRQLPNYLNVNLNPTSTYNFNYTVAPSTGTSNCGPVACGTVIPVKVYANRLQTGATSGTYNYSPLLNPNYNAVSEVIANINANYHALSVDVTRRQNKYLSFDANYTWSHSLDFNQNQATAPGTNNWFDPYGNTRANYGNSALNVPHRVVAWGLFNIPGTGKEGLKYLTDGWSIKPLLQVQSGLPYSVNTTGNAPNQCYALGCLESAGSGLSGTGVSYIPFFGRNSLRQPVTAVVDARVEKDFPILQKYNLQLIGEGFNLANHQNVTGVNTTGYAITTGTQSATAAAQASTLVYQPTFQTISSVNSNYAYNVRLIQLAARFVF